MSGLGVEFGYVAALEREVADVVRGWTVTTALIGSVERKIFYNYKQQAALVCAGTGEGRAYIGAKAFIEKCAPRVVVSIGFAGSCVRELHPGALVVPSKVVDAVSGKEFPCAFGSGTLATLGQIAGKTAKEEAAARFGAVAVEMEAIGVAAAAADYGREFVAIKAISDGAEDELDFLAGFLTPEGFGTVRFMAHIAVRPELWGRVAALHRHSKLACAALDKAVSGCNKDWRAFSAKYSAVKDSPGNNAAASDGSSARQSR
jgi:nucleoside phosphorylase